MKRVVSVLCCSVFAGVVSMPISMHAQADSNKKASSHISNSEASNSTQKPSPSKANDKMQVSKKAVHALRLTQDARQALINKDQASAQKQVNEALNLVNEVEQKTPTNPKDKTRVVPIYAELEQTSFLEPALSAKNEAKSGEQRQQAANETHSGSSSSQSGNTSSNALPQSDQMSNAPEVVKWVEGGYSYIGLDLDAAREHLQAAQQALKNNNPGNADLELARAEGSIVTGEIQSNMPLVRARENLSLAQDDMKQGNYTKAKVDLKATGKALKDYSNSNAQAPHAKEARNLGNQISSATNSITQNHTGMQQKVANWWNQLADWTNQS